ncbi:MAG: Transcriptional regulatory protein LiaR [Myxococcota bacterium]|nr:Transcriptional regulatory protein LiaR [Myxococcota bacterium]
MTRTQGIQVVVVEDDPAQTETYLEVLGREPDIRVLGAYHSAINFLAKAESLLPQVVIMDLGLPGIDGIEATWQLKKKLPNTRVIVMTIFDDAERITQAIMAGADGYLIKSRDDEVQTLGESVRNALRGESPMSGVVARKVLEIFRESSPRTPVPQDSGDGALTRREREILDFLVSGMTHKQVAEQLDIRPNTVRTHIQQIYKKLQVKTRGQLVNKVLRR